MKRLLYILSLALAAVIAAAPAVVATPADTISATTTDASLFDSAVEAEEKAEDEGGKLDFKGIIFDHLLDRYGWEVPFDHHHTIPLPVIVIGKDTGLKIFSSSRVDDGKVYDDGTSRWEIAPEGTDHEGDVVQILPDGSLHKPIDISITKNVCALWITVILVLWAIMSVARWHRNNGYKAPRRVRGAIEAVITFVYDGVIRPTLGVNSRRFAPYLLTVFFFILFMNLLGLAVIFPGGANLTGNIAVTLVLSIFTFLATNLFGTKHYWKEIFWPDVPLWLKFPLPIMPVIEIFGALTKPAALTVRLFANMMGGHMIVIVLTLLIFIFAAMGAVVAGATTVISVLFSIFMLLIDVLVSFIQAYVFTMLSTIFISFAQEKGHDEHPAHPAPSPALTTENK